MLNSCSSSTHLFYAELYKLTGEILGEGAYASVQTCVNIYTDLEYAVKIIEKIPGHARARVFREVETFHHCAGHPGILQLIEFFEDDEVFYLVFEKVSKGMRIVGETEWRSKRKSLFRASSPPLDQWRTSAHADPAACVLLGA